MRITKMLVSSVAAAMIMSACSTPKNITYMQGLTQNEVISITNPMSIKVKPEDKLYILVNTQKQELNELFNLRSTSTAGGSTRPCYTVNPRGYINFPMLGEVYVEGKTRSEIADYLVQELTAKDLVKNPVVTVEFEDMGVFVGGEVNHPGKLDINRDRLTVVQALLMAGDLTIQGKRENILVLREDGSGKQVAYRVDLTDTDNLFNSPVYYLQQNDVVIVEPNDVRKRQTTANGNTPLTITFWMSLASFAASMAVLIFR